MSLDNINNIDSNERVIWEFTIGIPITYHHSFDNKKELFEDAVIDITRELTQITEGLTYQYCYGTWSEGTKVPSRRLGYARDIAFESSLLLTDQRVERNYSVRISIVVLPEIAEDVYNSVKDIISNANIKYGLDVKHIHAMKSYGTARHFII